MVATASGPGTDGLSMRIDGTELPLERTGDIYMARPKDLTAGQHVLLVSANGFPLKSSSVSRTFTVDLSGPRLVLPARIGAPATQPVILTGVAENAVTVTVEGQQVPVVRGRFDVGLVSSDRVVTVHAVDQFGVAETANVTVTTQPVAPTQPARRGVHITSTGWADPGLRNAVLDLARQKRIDAVQLDIKDEGGIIGYASQVALANEVGATTQSYDAAATVAELKGLGVRVVGRIVNFLDPKLAAHSLAAGRMDELILNADGSGPYQSGYGAVAFTNFASPAVRQYNIDLAVEAAKLGFDEILFDYVRRPDGAIETMTIPGLTVDPAIGVADFVRATREALTGMPVTLGISVFGIAATRPEPIAQDMRLLLPWVDYIAPMVYPSHWGPGEYGLANPNANPYEIVKRSLTDFHDHRLRQRRRGPAVAAGLLGGRDRLRARQGDRPGPGRGRDGLAGLPALELGLVLRPQRPPAPRLTTRDRVGRLRRALAPRSRPTLVRGRSAGPPVSACSRRRRRCPARRRCTWPPGPSGHPCAGGGAPGW